MHSLSVGFFKSALVVLVLSTSILAGDSKPAAKTAAYTGATIFTANGKEISPGVLIVAGNKIVAVGRAVDVKIPEGAEIHPLDGKVIIPGLVDTHSHLGVYSRPAVPSNGDGNEMSGPVQSVVRAIDAINPRDPGIRMAQAGGVTSANIMPGSGNVIGGQTFYVKLRGDTVEKMRLISKTVVGGLKMANGENPKRAYGGKGQAPATRMKLAALQRAEFVKAREYQAKWSEHRRKAAAGDKSTPPSVDLGLEPLVEVLERKRTVHFHTHRADDIMTAMRLAEEFGFELVIQHGTESYKIADEIAKRKFPVSMTIPDSPGGKAEVADFMEECGHQLTRSGVKLIVNTDDPVTESRFLLRTAAIPIRGGLSEEVALRSVTLHPAQAMHVDDQVGSLEPGKDADFVVLSGRPFSVYSRILETYVDGVRVFDFANTEDRKFQTGGFMVAGKPQPPAPPDVVQPGPDVEKPIAKVAGEKPTGSTSEFVILAGTLHTVSHGSVKDAAVLVRNGKIAFAGPRANLKIAAGMRLLQARHVTPGLIDAYSSVPLSGSLNIAADQDMDETTDPVQAELRVLDAFNPREPLLRFLLEQGVTVLHACPGRSNVIAGQTGVFRTHGRSADTMTIRFPQAIMFNLGDRPKAAYAGKKPGTRLGVAALIRTALSEAASADPKLATKDAKPQRNLKNEALKLLVDRKIPAMICAQRADDIGTGLRLLNEFKIRGSLAMATEAYIAADQIRDAKVPVIVHPTMQGVGDLETINSSLGNAWALAQKRIPFAVCSGFEGYVPKTRVIRQEAAIAMVNGLGFEAALNSITLAAAKILDIDDRYGSVDVGKIADLVLYDGDPFEYRTHVTFVIVDGRIVHDRAENKRVPFQRLAYFASPEVPCCLGLGW